MSHFTPATRISSVDHFLKDRPYLHDLWSRLRDDLAKAVLGAVITLRNEETLPSSIRQYLEPSLIPVTELDNLVDVVMKNIIRVDSSAYDMAGSNHTPESSPEYAREHIVTPIQGALFDQSDTPALDGVFDFDQYVEANDADHGQEPEPQEQAGDDTWDLGLDLGVAPTRSKRPAVHAPQRDKNPKRVKVTRPKHSKSHHGRSTEQHFKTASGGSVSQRVIRNIPRSREKVTHTFSIGCDDFTFRVDTDPFGKTAKTKSGEIVPESKTWIKATRSASAKEKAKKTTPQSRCTAERRNDDFEIGRAKDYFFWSCTFLLSYWESIPSSQYEFVFKEMALEAKACIARIVCLENSIATRNTRNTKSKGHKGVRGKNTGNRADSDRGGAVRFCRRYAMEDIEEEKSDVDDQEDDEEDESEREASVEEAEEEEEEEERESDLDEEDEDSDDNQSTGSDTDEISLRPSRRHQERR